MKKFLLSLVTSSTLLFANTAQININNDTLEVEANLYLNDSYHLNTNSNCYFVTSYLHTDAYKSTPSQSLTTIGIKFINPYTDDNGFSVGIGMNSVYATYDNKSFLATPLSLYGPYELNEMVFFDAKVGYAPRVLSYMDAQDYQDGYIKANYKVLDDGYIYVGLRDIKTTYKITSNIDKEIKYDDSVFFGFRVRF